MYVSFNASESVRLSIENEEKPIKHYLRQPKRLVHALADSQLMKQVADDLYELKMRPINFMEIYHFQPIVLLKVWSGSNGSVYLQSVECQIEGIEYINKRFSLKLKGVLYPHESNGQTTLEGQSDLEVGVGLPAALMFTPKVFLERAGNKLLKSILGRIKNKLTTQLIQDYRAWALQTPQAESELQSELRSELGY